MRGEVCHDSLVVRALGGGQVEGAQQPVHVVVCVGNKLSDECMAVVSSAPADAESVIIVSNNSANVVGDAPY